MTEQDITIYVNEKGVIENPKKDIFGKKVIITIDINSEVKQKIKEKNIKIAFCDNFLDYFDVSSPIEYLEFIDKAEIEIIGNSFLCYNKNLISLNLSKLLKVTTIGDHFLLNCDKLEVIDLLPLSNIKKIGKMFFTNSRLTNLDLSQLSQVTQIGYDFLSGLKSTNIILPQFSQETQIGESFLSASKFTNIDLSPLSLVTQLGSNFLSNCLNLTNIDLSKLLNLKKIPSFFLQNCTNLKEINLSGLSKITVIEYGFLKGCINLENIDLSGLSNLIHIEAEFLSGCSSLKNIDLTPLLKIKKIDFNFLNNSTKIESIKILPYQNSILFKDVENHHLFPKVIMDPQYITLYVDQRGMIDNPEEEISIKKVIITINIKPEIKQILKEQNKKIFFRANFLQSEKMEYLEFIDNVGIEFIGDNFLLKCSNLKEINLLQLSKVTEIGPYFLYGCSKLENIKSPGVSNVTEIRKSLFSNDVFFLSNCSSLTEIDLSLLSKVKKIGGEFLSGCSKLMNVDLTPLQNINYIGYRFLRSCNSLQSIKILPHQRSIVLKNNQELQTKLVIDTEWYNTPEGKIWIENTMQQCNNIQNSDILLDIIDFL
jgi:hypothetical protein